MRIGLELGGEPDVPGMVRLAQAAEAAGYDSVWLTETRFTRDAIVPAAAVAAATRRVRVGTAVVNPFTRGAALLAVTFATLDELAGGRLVAGIGPGSPTVLAQQGIAFDRPLRRTEETVDIVRRLIAGERLTLHGDAVSIDRLQLDFAPVRPSVPIWLGVTGPRALALAGRIADGVILNGFVSVGYTRRAVDIVRAAARAAGRDPGTIEIGASIVTSLDDDVAIARDRVRPSIATYLARFPHIAREADVDDTLLAAVADVHDRAGAQAGGALLDDALVDRLTCCGDVARVRAGLAERIAAGVDLPIVGLLGPNVEQAIHCLRPDSGR